MLIPGSHLSVRLSLISIVSYEKRKEEGRKGSGQSGVTENWSNELCGCKRRHTLLVIFGAFAEHAVRRKSRKYGALVEIEHSAEIKRCSLMFDAFSYRAGARVRAHYILIDRNFAPIRCLCCAFASDAAIDCIYMGSHILILNFEKGRSDVAVEVSRDKDPAYSSERY